MPNAMPREDIIGILTLVYEKTGGRDVSKTLAAAKAGRVLREVQIARAIASLQGAHLSETENAQVLEFSRNYWQPTVPGRTEVIRFRATPDEKEEIEKAAAADDVTVSDYIRRRLGL